MRSLFQQPERHGYLIAIGAMLVATALFLPGRGYFARLDWALLYLLVISLVASLRGVHATVIAALLAFVLWEYFFSPPYGTLWIVDTTDWLVLLVFLLLALVMGAQTGRLRAREAQALAREREGALLNHVSSALVSITGIREMAQMLLDEIAHFSGAREVVLWLPDATGALTDAYRVLSGGCSSALCSEAFARWVFLENKAIGLPGMAQRVGLRATHWPISLAHESVVSGSDCRDIFLPLQTASSIEGVLQIAPATTERASSLHELQSLISMANLASAFLENQRLFSTAIKAEALQEVDRLKTTLISSVSHELKTPLAAITATLTNLLAEDVEWSVPLMREELRYADANVERLHDNIGALLDFARLESADWKTQFDWYELDDLLGIVRERLLDPERSRIVLKIADDFPPLYIDCQQMTRAIQHLLENALSYAPTASPIVIGGGTTAQEIRLWIEDSGPGVPAAERARIFEKFYRGSASGSAAQGTGLGLAIAAEIVRNHHGRLWVEDVHPHGARFVMAIARYVEG